MGKIRDFSALPRVTEAINMMKGVLVEETHFTSEELKGLTAKDFRYPKKRNEKRVVV